MGTPTNPSSLFSPVQVRDLPFFYHSPCRYQLPGVYKVRLSTCLPLFFVLRALQRIDTYMFFGTTLESSVLAAA